MPTINSGSNAIVQIPANQSLVVTTTGSAQIIGVAGSTDNITLANANNRYVFIPEEKLRSVNITSNTGIVDYAVLPQGSMDVSDMLTRQQAARADITGVVASTESGDFALPDGSEIKPLKIYTWATVPTPSVLGNRQFFVSDVGLHGSLWYSDGDSIGLVNGSVIIAQRNVAGTTLTGTTTETTDVTIPILAGLMGLNGALEIITKTSCNNSAGSKTTRIRLDGNQLNNPQVTTSVSSNMTTTIQNRNSASSQIGGNGSLAATTNAWFTSAVNTANQTMLTISQQLSNSADSMTLETYSVRLVRP